MAKNRVKKSSKSKSVKKPGIPPKALPVTLLSGFLVRFFSFYMILFFTDSWLGLWKDDSPPAHPPQRAWPSHRRRRERHWSVSLPSLLIMPWTNNNPASTSTPPSSKRHTTSPRPRRRSSPSRTDASAAPSAATCSRSSSVLPSCKSLTTSSSRAAVSASLSRLPRRLTLVLPSRWMPWGRWRALRGWMMTCSRSFDSCESS